MRTRKNNLEVDVNGSLSNAEENKLEKAYNTGPAAFGSAVRLQKHSGISKSKVEKFLEGKNAHTKYQQKRSRFPRLKVVAYRINEIWSIDVAYVDKLAKYNKDVKYLLVAVDVLSRYLRVQPMKNKYAKTAVEAFKNMLKSKKVPEKVWTDKGTEFHGEFAAFCTKKGIHAYTTESETKSCFAERNIRSLKALIHKYLEEKWTWIYLPKLQDFVKTINTRVNRTINLAPYQVTKAHEPYLIELATNARRYRTPKYKVGDFVRIRKEKLVFNKGYTQNFSDEIFRIKSLETTNPPTYSIVDANEEVISGKFYESELNRIKHGGI